MNPNSFDKEVKAKLYAAETDVPDHLWTAVAKNLAPQKKRRWWLWFLIPGVLGLGSGTVILLKPQDVNRSQVKMDVNVESPLTETAMSADTELPSTKSAVRKIQQLGLTTTGVAKNVKSLTENTARNKSLEKKVSFTTVQNTAEILSPNTGQPKSFEKSLQTSAGDRPNQSFFEPTSKAKIELAPTAPIETISSPFLDRPDPNLKICPSFARSRSIKPFMEFSFGAGVPLRTLEDRNQEIIGYKENREQTEKVRSSLAIQGMVGIEIKNQFEVKAGLGLSKIYEVFDYVDETASRTITSTIVDTLRDMNGNIIGIRIDTSITTEYGQRIKLSQNRYTFLNVPVLAAYRFKVRDHQFFVQGGAIFNLSFKTKGDIRSPEDKIQSIDTDDSENTIFRKNSGVELTGSIGYELEMSDRSSLRFSATYRHALNDLTLAGYPLGQRYKHIHLGVSLKHNLK